MGLNRNFIAASRSVLWAGLIALIGSTAACTGQIPGSFRFKQQDEAFQSQLQINTTIDLLLVVDNSASMDVSQDKLRQGFVAFSEKYMQPTWDIRVAVITTDTYLANSVFTGYLTREIPLSGGMLYGDLVPVWGSSYAKLLPGYHDGPIPGLCSGVLPYFLYGVTSCAQREVLPLKEGIASCISPGVDESAIEECVNTVVNNTVRSGSAIISTLGQSQEELKNKFMVNVTTGSVGHGSERGIGSLLQLLDDNETSDTAFFRKGSTRGIIFVADEEDQTMILPETPDASFSPWTDYNCDQAGLKALNPAYINYIENTLCCTGGACRYGSSGITCEAKTVDGLTYTPSICPRSDKLVSIDDVKARLEAFFRNLDELDELAVLDSYFVASIVPTTRAGIEALQAERNVQDEAVATAAGQSYIKMNAVDRGDRYIALGDVIASPESSLALDINAPDYSPILDAIGQAIIEKKSIFTLARAPTGEEEMIVKVRHADGSTDVIPSTKFVIDGKSLIITDLNLVLSFKSTDSVLINYQPRTLY